MDWIILFPIPPLLSANEVFCYSQSRHAAMQLVLHIVFVTENDAVEVGNTDWGYDCAPVGFTDGVSFRKSTSNYV